jgi:type IV pilus assembly protein PilW
VYYSVGGTPGPGNCTDQMFGSVDCTDLTGATGRPFPADSTVSRLVTRAYYLTGGARPSLVMGQVGYNSAQDAAALLPNVLTRDVEQMQLRYGISDDGQGTTAQRFVTADQVTDWERVYSVEITLLLRSADPNVRTSTMAETFDIQGVAVTTNDRHLRKLFTTTVALRNALP